MGKASRTKRERVCEQRERGMAQARILTMGPGEVLVKSFFPKSEAEMVATTPVKMVEEALRCDDRMGLLCAKLACDMVGDSMLDFAYPGVAGFFSDAEGSIFDAAFYYGATDCLRFLCREGFKINHPALLSIAKRVYWLIDDMSLQSPNYLPVAVVLEAYLREMVRRYGLAASKVHVATPGGDGLICHRALLMLGVIEDELARGASSQPDSTSTSESFTAQS